MNACECNRNPLRVASVYTSKTSNSIKKALISYSF